MKITCPDGSMFQDPSLQAESSVIAECGPEQYRFTLTSEGGYPVANTVKNDMFGCGKLTYFEKHKELGIVIMNFRSLSLWICLHFGVL